MHKRIASLIRRFKTKFIIDDPTGCWLWTGTKASNGYGLMSDDRLLTASAHRISWRIHRGEIPYGMCVLHRCDVKRCVNPAHLFIGTLGENNSDRARKGRNSDRRGEKHHHAKLSDKQVLEIRTSKDSQNVVSEKYGISQSQVSDIRNMRAWKHI
jgi:hypothetical protein